MAKFFWNLRHGRSHSEKVSQPERLLLMEDALKMQEMFLKRKMIGEPPNDEYNFLLFVEHDKVYVWTEADQNKIDRIGNNAFLLRPNMGPLAAPTHVLTENRASSITFHGPGQLVCYMILCIEDLGLSWPGDLSIFCAIIDETIKDFLSGLDIRGYTTSEICEFTDPDLIEYLYSRKLIQITDGCTKKMPSSANGIWVISDSKKLKKIAPRGIKIVTQRYLENEVKHFTKYGFAVNLFTDLAYFDYIYHCGLDMEMTSVEAIKGKAPPIHKAAPMLAESFMRAIRKFTKNESHELI